MRPGGRIGPSWLRDRRGADPRMTDKMPAMVEASGPPVVVTGEGREAGTSSGVMPVRFELGPTDFSVRLGAQPVTAAYRDLTTLSVDQGRVLLVLGSGPGALRVIAERLGSGLGTLMSEMRERRARQMLADRLIDLSADERIDLLEYAVGEEHGVAQVAHHAWGFVLMPLDERRGWQLVRRADMRGVAADQSAGRVRVERLGRSGLAEASPIELLGLGADAERTRARLAELHEGAPGDAAAIVGALLPGEPIETRRRAAALLLDGRPISPAQLGDAWPAVEKAVLVDPKFAASYAALVQRAGGDGPRWLALAPRRPLDPSEHNGWFLVGLPGNLLAFELVSEGSHATYLFRVVSRGVYRGQGPAELAAELDAAAFDVSESLIDTRFLREPIYLTSDALAQPDHLRYRLAIAALPSLRAARARFVGRLIHRDDESWSKSLDEAIAWNAATQDDQQVWPGGVAPDDEETGGA